MGLKMAATSLPWLRLSVPPKRRRLATPLPWMLLSPKRILKLHGRRSYGQSWVQISASALSASSGAFPDEEFLENVRRFDAGFPEKDSIILGNIGRKANSVGIPVSLQMIKHKKQGQEGLTGAGESACCSVKKAFSSMVFIIRELHSYTLRMRAVHFYEDLQGILAAVHKEMNASFVWLFQKVFSHTPVLMVHVMILLVNYSVYSMSRNAAIAATPHVVEVSVVEDHTPVNQEFDSSFVRTLGVSSLNGKMASVGGNGGSGKYRPVGSGMDNGDGRFNESSCGRSDGVLLSKKEDEEALWEAMVEEASSMEAATRDESLDHETVHSFVSPVIAKIEGDGRSEVFKTELQYQTDLTREPDSPLLLANYAQFLYVVARDYDRAEGYFKRATEVEPKDAEALNKYANFLWVVRNDLWGAEEAYLEAISAEPGNAYYAATYAHFLWNTGGQDTCFPLEDSSRQDS